MQSATVAVELILIMWPGHSNNLSFLPHIRDRSLMIVIGVRAEENFDWAANILANIVCKDGFPNSHLY